VRANESAFKQTASALHVLARRTDRSAFDAVDRELGQALVTSAAAAAAAHPHGAADDSRGSVDGGGGGGGREESRGRMGGARRSVIGGLVFHPDLQAQPGGGHATADGSPPFEAAPRDGERHISLRGLGRLTIAAARAQVNDDAAAGRSGGAGADPDDGEVAEIRAMMLEAARNKETLTPEQAARVREVMMRGKATAQGSDDQPHPGAEEGAQPRGASSGRLPSEML